jgi:hypothetical protein
MKTQRLLASAITALSCCAFAETAHLGTWRYRAEDALVEVRLKENGECFVTVGRALTGHLQPNCRYLVTGAEVLIALPQREAPRPIRLISVANWEILRVEGEGQRYLRKLAPWEE